MTYAEAKKRVQQLLDEKTDKDYRDKFPGFFDSVQRDVATYKPIVRRYVLPVTTTGQKKNEYPMPENFYRVYRVWKDWEIVSNGEWMGTSILIPDGDTARYEIEYFAYPEKITAETPEDYEFELAADAQEAMIVGVAHRCLAMEYDLRHPNNFYAMYQGMLQNLDSGQVDSFEICGGIDL